MKTIVVLIAITMLLGCAGVQKAMEWKKTIPTRKLTYEQALNLQENWHNLRPRMTISEVIDLLGYPQWFAGDPSFVYSSHGETFSVFVYDRGYRVFFDPKTERVTKFHRMGLW